MAADRIPRLAGDTLDPGTLRALVTARTRDALASHALAPLATSSRIVPDRGIGFIVRVLATFDRKPRPPAIASARANPFLPPDPALLVSDLSATHLAVLNKFNVCDLHLLIVTRAFESQRQLLTLEDFEALSVCLSGYDGLGFYNGGRAAGASQEHKHLQYVPVPLAETGDPIPVDGVIKATVNPSHAVRCPELPFDHLAMAVNLADCRDSGELAESLLGSYRALCGALEIGDTRGEQRRPYNLLVTRKWILMVPRTRELVAGVSINSLGFAGSLLVKDDAQLERLLEIGPMEVLRRAAAGG